MDVISSRVHNAKIITSEIVALGVKKISFQIEDEFIFQSGQYIWVEIGEMLVNDPKGNRRAYSISAIPNENNIISIVARVGESGYIQSLFSMDIGSAVKIHGPFGSSFVLKENISDNIIMIAGGVGVTPFISVINDCTQNSYSTKIRLVYLNNNKEVTPFLDELKAFRKNNSNFDYTLKYTHFEWSDIKNNLQLIDANTKFWISGTQGFVDHVSIVLKEGGISLLDMVFENYYPTNQKTLNMEKIEKSLKDNNVLTQAIQNSTNHTIITDINGIVLFANKASERITGYSKEEILGNTPRLWGGLMDSEFYKRLWESKISGKSVDGEIINRRKSGEVYYALAHISAIRDENNLIIGYVGTETDITDIKSRQNELERINSAMVGRELKMIELKKEIEKMKEK